MKRFPDGKDLYLAAFALLAELGKHNVIIQNREPETDDSGNRILPGIPVTIPAKYQQPGALTAEVRAGSNEVNFTLDAQ